jgi:hypothetical protein
MVNSDKTVAHMNVWFSVVKVIGILFAGAAISSAPALAQVVMHPASDGGYYISDPLPNGDIYRVITSRGRAAFWILVHRGDGRDAMHHSWEKVYSVPSDIIWSTQPSSARMGELLSGKSRQQGVSGHSK